MSFDTTWWFNQPWEFVNRKIDEEWKDTKNFNIKFNSFYLNNKNMKYRSLFFPFVYKTRPIILTSQYD